MNKTPRARNCSFCINAVKDLDYKDTSLLQRYTSSYGKIVPRRKSGVCSKHQRLLAQNIKRSRFMALLPFLTR